MDLNELLSSSMPSRLLYEYTLKQKQRLSPEYERLFLEYEKGDKFHIPLVLYCIDVRGRWEEAEPILVKSIDSGIYAALVLKRRWPEAEPIILTNPWTACFYARDVIGGRWEKAEKVLLESKVDSAIICYICDVIKGPWKVAEPILFEDNQSWVHYKSISSVVKEKNGL